MIVTGQQPAVGGGPLYTLVKVAHAVALGRARQEAVLFWCASEDHDLGEASHADLVRRDGRITRVNVDLGGGRAALRHRPAATWWVVVRPALAAELGPGLGSTFLDAQAPRGDEGMGAWLCRLLGVLFPGLETVEAHSLRSRWLKALELAVTKWPRSELEQVRQQLLAQGVDDAFGVLDEAPLFRDLPSGRSPLTTAEAVPLLPDHLEELSPGAALRPILQQAALPCSTYVGGPGELAYHRFLTPLYGALGVTAPELLPRCSLTLVPAWIQREAERRQLSAAALATAQEPLPVDDTRLADFDRVLAGLTAEPRLAGSLRRLQYERQHLATRVARLERRGQIPLGVVQAWLTPRGGRQERTMSLIQAIWEHGPGIAPRLVAEAAACAPGEHRWVAL